MSSVHQPTSTDIDAELFVSFLYQIGSFYSVFCRESKKMSSISYARHVTQRSSGFFLRSGNSSRSFCLHRAPHTLLKDFSISFFSFLYSASILALPHCYLSIFRPRQNTQIIRPKPANENAPLPPAARPIKKKPSSIRNNIAHSFLSIFIFHLLSMTFFTYREANAVFVMYCS
jgi:hypothetical protein